MAQSCTAVDCKEYADCPYWHDNSQSDNRVLKSAQRKQVTLFSENNQAFRFTSLQLIAIDSTDDCSVQLKTPLKPKQKQPGDNKVKPDTQKPTADLSKKHQAHLISIVNQIEKKCFDEFKEQNNNSVNIGFYKLDSKIGLIFNQQQVIFIPGFAFMDSASLKSAILSSSFDQVSSENIPHPTSPISHLCLSPFIKQLEKVSIKIEPMTEADKISFLSSVEQSAEKCPNNSAVIKLNKVDGSLLNKLVKQKQISTETLDKENSSSASKPSGQNSDKRGDNRNGYRNDGNRNGNCNENRYDNRGPRNYNNNQRDGQSRNDEYRNPRSNNNNNNRNTGGNGANKGGSGNGRWADKKQQDNRQPGRSRY